MSQSKRFDGETGRTLTHRLGKEEENVKSREKKSRKKCERTRDERARWRDCTMRRQGGVVLCLPGVCLSVCASAVGWTQAGRLTR